VDFLGIEIQREWGADTMTLKQKAATEAMSAAHGVQGACRAVPMFPDCFSSLCAIACYEAWEPMADELGYQKVIMPGGSFNACVKWFGSQRDMSISTAEGGWTVVNNSLALDVAALVCHGQTYLLTVVCLAHLV
jgi:hypothetical protein